MSVKYGEVIDHDYDHGLYFLLSQYLILTLVFPKRVVFRSTLPVASRMLFPTFFFGDPRIRGRGLCTPDYKGLSSVPVSLDRVVLLLSEVEYVHMHGW